MTEGKGHLRKQFGDFPGCPGVKTPSFHFRGMQIGSLVWNKDLAGHATWPKKKKKVQKSEFLFSFGSQHNFNDLGEKLFCDNDF